MRFLLIVLLLASLLLNSCLIQPPIPRYGTKRWNKIYSGGDGSSTAKAIIVNPKEAKKRSGLETVYVLNVLKVEGKSLIIKSIKPYSKGSKTYMLISVQESMNMTREFHFDTTQTIKYSIKRSTKKT